MDVRATLLEVIAAQSPRDQHSNLQSRSVLNEAAKRLGAAFNQPLEQALLTAFHDLFRTGYLAWGFNIANPDPPFFHLTEIGRQSLERLGRDPGNPEGYFASLARMGRLDAVAEPYLREAVKCFVNDMPRAAAVMVGCSAERLTLEIAERLREHLHKARETVPKGLSDWKIKTVLESIDGVLGTRLGDMPHALREEYSSYWPAFTQQIRAVRNEAGHPKDLEPVTLDSVHASLLIFPELVKLAEKLREWIELTWKRA